MCKRFLMLLTVCFFLMPAFAAYADVIIEPDNEFYKQHNGSFIYLDRDFVVSAEGGSVAVKREPGAKTDIIKLQNGQITTIKYTCLYNGAFWGFTFDYSGWIRLDEMLVLYDYVSFAEEHSGDFYTYTGDYAEIKKAGAAIVWPWPGADTSLWTYENLNTEGFQVSQAYRDEEGREWGFITYLYGNRNLWFCLSDPLNPDLSPSKPTPKPAVWVSDTAHVDIRPAVRENMIQTLAVIAALVAALAAGTAVLIKVFWKPNTSKDKHKK